MYTHDGVEYENAYDFSSKYKFLCDDWRETTISECLCHADCRCAAYLRAVSILEKVEEQDWYEDKWREEHQ